MRLSVASKLKEVDKDCSPPYRDTLIIIITITITIIINQL